MPNKKKQKKNEDFKKVKLKIGKKLKKTSTTDTTIKAKKVVLTAQFEEKLATEDKPLSFRGLTLDELCKQLGHFNQNIRKDAIIGTKQLLTSRPDLISIHLRTIIPAIARLLGDNNRDGSLNSQLRSLFQVICTAPSQAMAAHISLFLAHVFRALSHMELLVRNFALSILSIVMTAYPSLCRNNADLFPSFVNFLGSSRKPAWNSNKFLDNILLFLNVYDVSRTRQQHCSELKIDFAEEKIQGNINLYAVFEQSDISSPFDFSVLTSTKSAAVSPFELPNALINLTNVLAPIITTSLLDDVGGAFLPQTLSIIETIAKAATNQPNAFLEGEFLNKVRASLETVKKAVSVRRGKNEKLKKATEWLFC